MPAIRYHVHENFHQTITHYRDFVLRPVRLKSKGQRLIVAQCLGFICNAGAALLKDARLAKVIATHITNGDGKPGSDWKPVPEDEYVWCVALVLPNGSHQFECYILVDDFGWPILTGKNRYDSLPPIDDYLPIQTIGMTDPRRNSI